MSGISTHILDLSTGSAAPAVPVALDVQDGAAWRTVAAHATDADGRVKALLPAGAPLAAATYRLRFDTAAHWRTRGVAAFHPHIEVCFTVADAARHHHVPLLISPFGYSTYRGT